MIGTNEKIWVYESMYDELRIIVSNVKTMIENGDLTDNDDFLKTKIDYILEIDPLIFADIF